MTKGVKLAIILFIGTTAAVAGYYFMVYRPAHPKPPIPPAPPDGGSGSGSGTGLGGPPPYTVIGKVAYASKDGVPVLNTDGTTYKTATKGEWIGVVEAQKQMGGKPFYQVGGSRYVPTAGVTLS